MNFAFTHEDEEFRRELRELIATELPPEWEGTDADSRTYDLEVERHMRRKLAERGWLTMAWPKEYGGRGASHMKLVVYQEEMTYFRAPGVDTFGIGMVGPTLMAYGTEEQKRNFLGRIAKGEINWCQGFSEPGAGSDLAGLQTRAVEWNDDYIVNGQKIWSSYAHISDWMFLLARTDPTAPKHKGITYFLLDMKTPGITIKPIVNITGASTFNEVFFDDVHIPKGNVVGEVNRGWYVAMATLNFERQGVTLTTRARRALDDLLSYMRESGWFKSHPSQHHKTRIKLAELELEIEVSRLLAYHVAYLIDQGQVPQHESSIAKLFASELLHRVANVGVNVLGLSGQLVEGDKWAVLKGQFRDMYLHTLSDKLGSGTSEIQRYIIASRGLGLPKGT